MLTDIKQDAERHPVFFEYEYKSEFIGDKF